MKITVKISKDVFEAVIEALKESRPPFDLTMIDRVYFYLFNTVMKKLQKKHIDKADDYSGKPIKLEFNYPEAAALFNELGKVSAPNIYSQTACRILRNQLHEKLI